MIERLKRVLSGVRDIDAWKITDRQVQGQELYFIGRDIDMQRSKQVRTTYLTIYKDFRENGKNYRGSVVVQIHPTYSDNEIRALIESSLEAAGYVQNEPYPLVAKDSEIRNLPTSNLAERPLEQWLAPIAETIYAQEDKEDARINSAELFLNCSDVRILNSKGRDVSYRSYSGYIELIAEATIGSRANDADSVGGVELYRELSFSEFEPEGLAAEVRGQLHYCSDRLKARPTPHLKHSAVLITGDPVPDFFLYYLTHSSAESVYSGLSTAKVGESIQGDGISGDRLNLSLEPYLKNSPRSAPVDVDGFALETTEVVKAGTLERYWGPLRFCHYLEVPATGFVGNVAVTTGSQTLEQLRRQPLLEVVYFSDFVCEPLTGDFGGEIRLAYYQEADGTRYPVTGGSVSGNIRDVQTRMYLSRESQIRAGFQGPSSVLLPEISVAGAAST
jgi:PmbA protein